MVLNASITTLLSIHATINILQLDNGTYTNMNAVNASIQTLCCRSATVCNVVVDTMLSINVSAGYVCLANTSCVQGNNENFYVGYCLKSCCIASENTHNSTIYNLACTDTSIKNTLFRISENTLFRIFFFAKKSTTYHSLFEIESWEMQADDQL